MSRTRIETRARARVLQALYAWDLRADQPLQRVAGQLWDELAVSADERQLAERLIDIVNERGAELDSALRDVTANWRLERLSVVDRCVLRLAAAELMQGETPPRVVIKESMRLAERYGSASSARFVNGVADALARRMGRLSAAR